LIISAAQAHFYHLISRPFTDRHCLQEEPDEHGQGKWEGKQEGKSDKRITESKLLPVHSPVLFCKQSFLPRFRAGGAELRALYLATRARNNARPRVLVFLLVLPISRHDSDS
jgi:hypothetical protein